MASPLQKSGVTELGDNIISYSEPLTEHQCNTGFPLWRNRLIYSFTLSLLFFPNFSSFGKNVTFDHYAGADCQQHH